jgi:hypothetical protein
MSDYNVMVPINWTNGSTNRFRVPVRYNGELTKASIEEIKKVATDYVISRGQTLAPYGKIEIYRKTK